MVPNQVKLSTCVVGVGPAPSSASVTCANLLDSFAALNGHPRFFFFASARYLSLPETCLAGSQSDRDEVLTDRV